MTKLLLVLGWVYWFIYQILGIALLFAGIIPIYIMARLHLWYERDSKFWMFPNNKVTAWRGGWLTFIWGNEEDGVTGAQWFLDQNADRPAWKNALIWAGVRNYADNMRLLPGASFLAKKADVTIKETATGYYAYTGWRSCYVFKAFGKTYRIGWLLNNPATDGDRAWPVAEKL